MNTSPKTANLHPAPVTERSRRVLGALSISRFLILLLFSPSLFAPSLFAAPLFTPPLLPKEPVRYLLPIFEKVVIQKDIKFGESTNFEGKTEKLLLDVYSPEGDKAKKRPVILWFHGGGFRPGNDKTQSYIVKLANDFARRGYVCVSINYRVRTAPKDDKKGTMTDAIADAMKGLNWIRSNQKQLKIDSKKIIVGGGSAGGMLAVNFCYKDQTTGEKWDKSGIIGLINLWGSPEPGYMFSTIDSQDPPTIVVHGTADKIVPFENSVQLQKELATNQIKHELVGLEGGEHTPVKFYNDFVEKIASFIYDLLSKK
jgi:acetyl esterase/lipase